MIGPSHARTGLPPLTALRAFEAAARHETFKAAAEELNITASAVSHQIAQLEDRLGVPLFVRRAGRTELSGEGRLLQPYLREAFARMAEGVALVGRRGHAELTVQIYITVAVRWLMPRLHTFQKVHPDLMLKFNASHLDWAFDPGVADVGLVCTREPDRPGLATTPLFDADLVLVCSPGLLANDPPLNTPGDIARHQRLQVYTAQSDWTTWATAAGITLAAGAASASFDSYLLVIEAACEGRGVAVVPHFLAANDIRAGRLIQPFSVTARQPERWVLQCRADLAADSRVVRFRDWLIGEVAADPLIGRQVHGPRAARPRTRRTTADATGA